MALRKKKYNDLGLGTKDSSGINVPFFERINFFHSLISMSWAHFFILVILSYFIVNILFASIYMVIGVEHLTGIDGVSNLDKFIGAFFFSAQTITTLGYGRVAPLGILANSIAAIESLLGLLAFALATGMLYGRFSKPMARIKYSEHAVVAPYQNINGFMFRMLNPSSNQLLEVEVTVTLSMQRGNTALRDFHLLDLERPKVVFMPYSWTIVHPINNDSPLYELTADEILKKDAEFIIMVKAFDESFSQTVYSRSSYKASELKWGEKFVYILKQENNGIAVDVSRIDETEKIELN